MMDVLTTTSVEVIVAVCLIDSTICIEFPSCMEIGRWIRIAEILDRNRFVRESIVYKS